MKYFLGSLLLLLVLCVKSPAPTVNFSSPPFSTDFIVNQPGNSIAIRFPAATNVFYIPGTSAFYSNQSLYIGTNDFAGGGGGGSGITQLTGDGTAGPGSGSQVFTLATVTGSPGTYRSVTINGKGLVTSGTDPTTVAGYGLSDTWANMAAALSGLVPTASMGSGTANGLTFLGGNGTWQLVVTNVVATNAGPPVLILSDTAFLNTNAFGSGGGGGGITQLTGDGTAGPGSGSQALTLKNTGTAGTYRSVTFDAQGRETAGTLPTTFAGYGIVDTWPNLAAALTLLIPQAALGTGSLGTGTKALFDDQTYKTISGGGGGFSNQLSTSMGRVFMTESTTLATSTSVNGTAVGDMNGDGIPDIVVDKQASTTVYTNTGNGTSFPQASAFTQTSVSGGLALADVNRDGRLDAVASSRSGNYWNVLTNDGNGNLSQLGSNYALATSTPASILVYVGNLDNNNSQDVIVNATGTNIVIYTNDGIGNFTFQSTLPSLYTSSRDLAIADMNGDGTNDIAIIPSSAITGSSQGFIVLTNNGNGVFSPWTTNLLITTGGLYSICTGDFNQDGKLDIAVAGVPSSSWVEVFTNNGNGFGLWSSNFFQFTSGGAMLRTASINGVTRPDLVANALNASVPIAVVFTNSGTTMVNALTNSQANSVGFLGIGDFNSDGFSDFEEYITSGTVGVFINTPIVSGYFNGNAASLTNGQITVVFNAGAVTPAASWTPGNPGGNFGTITLNTNFAFPFHVTTSAATSGTVAGATGNQVETVYLSAASPIATLTVSLPSASTISGRFDYIHTKSTITNLTVTGGSFVDTAITTLTNGGTLIYEVIDGSGTYIRLSP